MSLEEFSFLSRGLFVQVGRNTPLENPHVVQSYDILIFVFHRFAETKIKTHISLLYFGNNKATLSEIYKEIEKIAKHLIEKKSYWKEKIRQKLQHHFISVERGVWAVCDG